MDSNSSSISGIILAGGKAKRMGGINKALIKIDNVPIIERILAVLRQVLSNIMIITNYPEAFSYLNLPMARDLIPNSGSLGGLYTGLTLCPTGHAFFVACDMPYLNAQVIRYIISKVDANDIVIPRIGGHLEPLHAIYSKKCAHPMGDLIRNGDYKILNLLPKMKLLELPEEAFLPFDPELKFISNINSPHDMKSAELCKVK